MGSIPATGRQTESSSDAGSDSERLWRRGWSDSSNTQPPSQLLGGEWDASRLSPVISRVKHGSLGFCGRKRHEIWFRLKGGRFGVAAEGRCDGFLHESYVRQLALRADRLPSFHRFLRRSPVKGLAFLLDKK